MSITTLQPTNRLGEIRLGRNFIREGDAVKVRPSRPGKRDGFIAKFRYAELNDDGTIKHVDVVGGKNGAFRSFPVERIERIAQTKGGEKVERTRG